MVLTMLHEKLITSQCLIYGASPASSQWSSGETAACNMTSKDQDFKTEEDEKKILEMFTFLSPENPHRGSPLISGVLC